MAKHVFACDDLKTDNMYTKPLVIGKGVEKCNHEDWFPLAEQNLLLKEIRLNNN